MVAQRAEILGQISDSLPYLRIVEVKPDFDHSQDYGEQWTGTPQQIFSSLQESSPSAGTVDEGDLGAHLKFLVSDPKGTRLVEKLQKNVGIYKDGALSHIAVQGSMKPDEFIYLRRLGIGNIEQLGDIYRRTLFQTVTEKEILRPLTKAYRKYFDVAKLPCVNNKLRERISLYWQHKTRQRVLPASFFHRPPLSQAAADSA